MPTINIKVDKRGILPTFQPYLFDYSYRYNVYYGGRGSGKTKFVISKLLLKGLKEKRRILLMRKETNKLKDSVFREMVEIINDYHLNEYFSINRTDFRLTCKLNGTEFKCLGLDMPEKIKGIVNISDVLLDEVTEFSAEDIELIDGTLRSNIYKLPLQMYFCFNPISKANFVYHYFGFDTDTVPPDTFIHHSTYLDNTFLDASYIRRMENMKERNFARWKVEALGEFTSLDKLVYQNWKIADFDYKQIKGDLLIGLDFGFVNDPSALVASILDEDNKKIYVFKEWGSTNKTNDQLAAVIKSLGFAKSTIIADSAEQKSIEEIKRCGIPHIKPCSKGKDSIIHGIQKLQQYDLLISEECVQTIAELENYSWQKNKNGEYINKPVDAFNHFLDALRYSLQCVDKGRKVKVIDKNLLGL